MSLVGIRERLKLIQWALDIIETTKDIRKVKAIQMVIDRMEVREIVNRKEFF